MFFAQTFGNYLYLCPVKASKQRRNILTASDVDLVNKGGTSEMFAGLEMKKYRDCFQKPEMHYWQNTKKGSNAEVDYLRVRSGKVLPPLR